MNAPALARTERDVRIYEEELREWLPPRILDVHVHVFERTCFPAEYRFPPKSCYRKFGCRHTLEQCLEISRILLPDMEFGMLCFGTPERSANREKASAYTGSVCDNKRIFGLTLVSPEDTVAEIEERIQRDRLIGYKPYHNLVAWKEAEAVTIPDMLPDEQMRLANDLGLAITLHIPRAGRLADPDNQEEMVALCERYPNAQIIVAHIGRAYFRRNVVGMLDELARRPNAWLDTAMVNHPGVLEYAFTHFPKERILFGSDAPVAWLRGKSVEINHQYAYLMGEDYAIGTSIHDAHHAVEFTFFYYEMLRGIREAAAKAGLSPKDVEGLFHTNAHTLLSGIAARLFGA